MSTNKQTTKYRPVLTASQIAHILHLAKSEQPISQASISLISTLAPFLAKIENAGITAAYTLSATSPKKSTLELLGGASTDSLVPLDANFSTKEEQWEAAYNKYTSDPASCSLQEIKDAKEHAYLNELMTPEEVADFEAAMLSPL